MLKEKNRRKFRKTWIVPDSATIRKEIIAADTSDNFVWSRKGRDFEDWEKRTSTSSALHRPDPYGIQSCFLDYSLNKKNRWKIPEQMGDMIEEIQDPFNNLRVSSSVHKVDHSHNLFLDIYMGNPRNPIVDQPCTALYDVSRDGASIVKTYSKTGKRGMRELASSSSDANESDKQSKNNDDKALHIHYYAWEIADSASLYNKRANKKKPEHPRSWNGISTRRPKYFNNRIDSDLYDD